MPSIRQQEIRQLIGLQGFLLLPPNFDELDIRFSVNGCSQTRLDPSNLAVHE
jgi:hypothetical protein